MKLEEAVFDGVSEGVLSVVRDSLGDATIEELPYRGESPKWSAMHPKQQSQNIHGCLLTLTLSSVALHSPCFEYFSLSIHFPSTLKQTQSAVNTHTHTHTHTPWPCRFVKSDLQLKEDEFLRGLVGEGSAGTGCSPLFNCWAQRRQ